MKISFIVVALNERSALPLLLNDLLAQDYPKDALEALLVDSASTDGTRGVMEAFAQRAPFPVRVLDNPRGWLASGINVALQHAQGDAVIRLDAHARIPADFLRKNAELLAQGHDIVGGSVLSTPPKTAWAEVMRALDASRFCGGAAAFRNLGAARAVDTLAYALYRRSIFDAVGLYDERLRRTEDNEMHYRMRQAGYTFWFSPEIASTHDARDSLRGQLRQKWGNGYWIGRTLHIQPRCFAPRHFAPAFFVLALLCLSLLAIWQPIPLLLLLGVYLACDLFFSIQACIDAERGKALTLLALPFLFPLVHLTYGAGTIVGALTPKAV